MMITSMLIIEDNDSDRELFLKALHTQCENIRSVKTLQDGIYQMHQEEPSVVLLDVGLPDAKDSHHAISSIKAVQRNSTLVVVSGNGDPSSIEEGIMDNADGWIVKGRWSLLLLEIRQAHEMKQTLKRREANLAELTKR